MGTVGKPIPHDSAVGHVTGTARFIDDIPPRADELYVGFVGSPIACGRVNRLVDQEARSVPGVACVLSAQDVPGRNRFGVLLQDEPFLADEELLYCGQPVIIVAAENRDALAAACRAIKIEVEEGEPVISIEDAIQRSRYLGSRVGHASG